VLPLWSALALAAPLSPPDPPVPPRIPGRGAVELAVGPWVGQHAPQGEGSVDTGFAWGGRARMRWTESWAVEAMGGATPAGPTGSLALARFLGDPSADLLGHVAVGAGLQGDGAGLLTFGGGFDVVLTRWLDLRAEGRFDVTMDGRTALLFDVAPMVHTRRRYDADADGVPDRADACPRQPEDRDGHADVDGCPDPDNDADGVEDLLDTCTDVPEDPDGHYDKDGCPDPDDDEDGVFDALDRCRAAVEDLDGFEDDDGCPDPDNDRDLVRDEYDLCDDVAEDTDNYEDDDGCPEPDNDGDGVADRWDADPLAGEVYNGWLDHDGMPDVVPPVLARLLGAMPVTFTEHAAGRTATSETVGLLGAVLASFPEARVELTVTAPDATVAAARAVALGEALVAAGAAEAQVVTRVAVGPAGVGLAMAR
jgi:hypothetical protein